MTYIIYNTYVAYLSHVLITQRVIYQFALVEIVMKSISHLNMKCKDEFIQHSQASQTDSWSDKEA